MSRDRWATFDCYGTLVDWDAGMAGAIRRVTPAHADAVLAAYRRLEPWVEAEWPFRRYRDVLRETLVRSARQAGATLPPGGDQVLGRTLPDWPVYPDVGPALGTLRDAGWRLAILSNVDRDLVAGTLQRLPVDVDLVVTAEDVGSYKPHPGHLLRFRETTGAGADAWIHVAMSMFHDITPAHELGIRGVYIARGPAKEDCRPAVAMLPDLVALPAVLEALVDP